MCLGTTLSVPFLARRQIMLLVFCLLGVANHIFPLGKDRMHCLLPPVGCLQRLKFGAELLVFLCIGFDSFLLWLDFTFQNDFAFRLFNKLVRYFVQLVDEIIRIQFFRGYDGLTLFILMRYFLRSRNLFISGRIAQILQEF